MSAEEERMIAHEAQARILGQQLAMLKELAPEALAVLRDLAERGETVPPERRGPILEHLDAMMQAVEGADVVRASTHAEHAKRLILALVEPVAAVVAGGEPAAPRPPARALEAEDLRGLPLFREADGDDVSMRRT